MQSYNPERVFGEIWRNWRWRWRRPVFWWKVWRLTAGTLLNLWPLKQHYLTSKLLHVWTPDISEEKAYKVTERELQLFFQKTISVCIKSSNLSTVFNHTALILQYVVHQSILVCCRKHFLFLFSLSLCLPLLNSTDYILSSHWAVSDTKNELGRLTSFSFK